LGLGSSPSLPAAFTDANWTALGSGVSNTVYAVAVSGSGVYAGGDFTEAGGGPANHIAKWDGSSWSALGSGMNNPVRALAVWGNDLYAAGEFTIAGGKVSAYVARAYLELPSLSILRSGEDVTLSWPASFDSFVLQEKPSLANITGWSNATYRLSTNGATKSATVPITSNNPFFRLIGN